VKQLKHSCHCLEQEVRSIKHLNKELESRMQERVSRDVVNHLKKKHEVCGRCLLPERVLVDSFSPLQDDMAQLKEKLKCLTERQELLDKTAGLLKSKEEEVKALKERLVALETAKSTSAVRWKSHSVESKRISQLEKHVRELEKVIQRKFPNSLSALILAANSSSELKLENK